MIKTKLERAVATMQKQYSFKNYINKNHYAPLFNVVAAYVKDNLSELNLYSSSVDVDALTSWINIKNVMGERLMKQI